jgi:hypothetical protein
MRRGWTILLGLAVIAAFAVLARTGGGASIKPAGGAPVRATTGSGAGAGLPLGAPRKGPPGKGYVVISQASGTRRYDFSEVDCIRSPNSPGGLLAKANTDPAKPNEVSIRVSTDDSTLTPIQLQIGGSRSWSDAQGTPRIHRADHTVGFTATLRSDEHASPVAVRGSLTCGSITTLG